MLFPYRLLQNTKYSSLCCNIKIILSSITNNHCSPKCPNQKYSEATPILPPGPLVFTMILEVNKRRMLVTAGDLGTLESVGIQAVPNAKCLTKSA